MSLWTVTATGWLVCAAVLLGVMAHECGWADDWRRNRERAATERGRPTRAVRAFLHRPERRGVDIIMGESRWRPLAVVHWRGRPPSVWTEQPAPHEASAAERIKGRRAA